VGEFSDSPKWRLVNDFTIHEDQRLKDRPFMLTCVPKTLSVKVTRCEVVKHLQWPSPDGDVRPEAYADASFLRITGELDDNVVVFNMTNGEVVSFDVLTNADIRPIARGAIGGRNNATTIDGIYFSGMSSREVPDGGLMIGEPGRLYYFPDFEDLRKQRTPAHLSATLFLDEDRLQSLLIWLTQAGADVRSMTLHLVVELFETEMSASLSEPWMTRNYGLLAKTSKPDEMASTSARIESLLVGGAPLELADMPAARETFPTIAAADFDNVSTSSEARSRTNENVGEWAKAIVTNQRYMLLAVLLLIVVVLIR
jgi:hypothetical protein